MKMRSRTIMRTAVECAALATVVLVAESAQADFLPVIGGPFRTPGSSGYQFPSSSPDNLYLSESGILVAPHNQITMFGSPEARPPIRWSPNLAPESLQPLSTAPTEFGVSVPMAMDVAGNVFGYSTKYTADGLGILGDRPVRWNIGSTNAIELGNLGLDGSGRASGRPFAVNAFGTAVGWSTKPGFNGVIAVRWNALGQATELGVLPITTGGTLDYYASDINSSGTTVGRLQAFTSEGSNAGTTATRWDAGSTVATDLGFGQANYINEEGVIAGYYNPFGTFQDALRWEPGAVDPTVLGSLGQSSTGRRSSTPRAINYLGTIAGVSTKYDATGTSLGNRAAKWDRFSTDPVELILPAGFAFSGATDINDSGIIVGSASNGGASTSRGVYWNLDGSVVQLNSLIDPTSGWILGPASGINGSNWITGVGLFDPDGAGGMGAINRVYVIQVPEVQPLGLVALGLAAALLTRWSERAGLVQSRVR